VDSSDKSTANTIYISYWPEVYSLWKSSCYMPCFHQVDSLYKNNTTVLLHILPASLMWTPYTKALLLLDSLLFWHGLLIKKLGCFISPCFLEADPSYINIATSLFTAFLRWTPYTKALVLSYSLLLMSWISYTKALLLTYSLLAWGRFLYKSTATSICPAFQRWIKNTKALLFLYCLLSYSGLPVHQCYSPIPCIPEADS
jgi:hypothetical protein